MGSSVDIRPEVETSPRVSLLVERLADAEIEMAPSLPDTWVMDIIHALDEDPRFTMIMVGREESAIGICTGAFFGGKNSAVIMGASGFMACIYAITKICYTYQIGFPIVMSMRGGVTDRATHHQANGSYLEGILDTLGMPVLMLNEDRDYDHIPDAAYHARIQKRPAIIGLPGRP